MNRVFLILYQKASNLLRIFLLDVTSLKFRSFARKTRLSTTNTNAPVVLIESPACRANLVGIRLFMKAYFEFHPVDFILYRVGPSGRFRKSIERLRFFCSIEKQFGFSKFIPILWSKHNTLYYEQFYKKNCGLRSAREFELFKYRGVLIGDLIYDEYLRRSKKKTIDFSDSHFLRIFHELTEYFHRFDEIFDEYDIEAVVVSNCVYHFAIPLRIACNRNLSAFQVTSETVYRMSKNRLHAYTEFLEYSPTPKNEEIPDFRSNLIEIKNRISRRFAGEVGVDMSYSTMSAFDKDNSSFTLKTNKSIKILIATHDFFDSPHSYGFNFYPDFYLWIDALGRISNETDYDWYLKTHPDPIGDSNQVLEDFINKYSNFHIIPPTTSHHNLISQGIDFVLTIFGTVGWEYPALGVPSINASSNNPHKSFSFSVTPRDCDDYESILKNLATFPKLEIREDDLEYFYYLHYFKKLKSYIYYDYDKYLEDIGGYAQSTTLKSALYFIEYSGPNRRGELEIINAIVRFLQSGDFRLDFEHFQRIGNGN